MEEEGGRIETQTCIILERERERSLPLDGASTRADSPWDRVRASISRQTSGRLVVEMPTQCPILSLSNRRAPLGIWRSPFQPNGIPPLSLFPGCPPRPRFSPLIPPAEFFWGAGFFDRDVSKKSRRRCLFLLSRQLRDQPSPNRFDPMGERRLENYLILDSFPNIFLHNSLQLSFEPIFVIFTSRKLNVFLLFFPSFRPPLRVFIEAKTTVV